MIAGLHGWIEMGMVPAYRFRGIERLEMQNGAG
jgi:hypothetical protein